MGFRKIEFRRDDVPRSAKGIRAALDGSDEGVNGKQKSSKKKSSSKAELQAYI